MIIYLPEYVIKISFADLFIMNNTQNHKQIGSLREKNPVSILISFTPQPSLN